MQQYSKIVRNAFLALGAFTSTTVLAGAVDVDVKGLIQLNGFHAFFDEDTKQFLHGSPDQDYNTNAYVQLAKLGLVGKINDDWSFVVSPLDYRYARSEASDSKVSRSTSPVLPEASVSYTGIKPVTLKLGVFRPGYGFENVTDDANLAFSGRSAVAQLLSSQPGLGLEVSGHMEGFTYAVSAHVPATVSNNVRTLDKNDWITAPDPGLNARVTYGIHWAEQGVLAHVGASLASVGSGNKLGWDISHSGLSSSAIPVQSLRTSIVTTPPVVLTVAEGDEGAAGLFVPFKKRFAVMGAEIAAQKGPFSAHAEYHYAKPEISGLDDADSALPTLKVRGFSIEAGYVITGETRGYCEHAGVFTNVVPQSETGAWEVVARLDQIKLEATQAEFKKTAYAAGVNYYVNSHATVKLNYALDCITGKGLTDTKLHAISLGTQFSF